MSRFAAELPLAGPGRHRWLTYLLVALVNASGRSPGSHGGSELADQPGEDGDGLIVIEGDGGGVDDGTAEGDGCGVLDGLSVGRGGGNADRDATGTSPVIGSALARLLGDGLGALAKCRAGLCRLVRSTGTRGETEV